MSYMPHPRPEVVHLSTVPDEHWIMLVVFDWILIVGAMYFAIQYPVWWVIAIAVVIIGSRQHALGVLAHDGAHGHGLSRLWLNDIVTNLFCLWPVGMDLAAYRSYHFAHHKYFGTVHDPELESKYWAGPNWDTPLTKGRLLRNFLLDLAGIGILMYKRRLMVAFLKGELPKKQLEAERKSLFSDVHRFGYLATIVLILLLLDLWIVLFLWVVSIITAGFAFFRIRVWSEHGGIFGTHRFTPTWWQRFLFFPHNTWCHYEHHKWSTIPLKNLPKARLLDTEVPVGTTSDIFHAILTAPIIPSGALPNGDFPPSITKHP